MRQGDTLPDRHGMDQCIETTRCREGRVADPRRGRGVSLAERQVQPAREMVG